LSQIVIGTKSLPAPLKGKHNVYLNLDVLIRTRLLIQANSGKGKSWLLRRLAEQLFGKVQVIIIDPEGEFASLREKLGFVLVGKGGETPADPRSAALVARKLLELRASAVCDIYELKPAQRHSWVKAFLDSMIDAPKNLWHPVIVIVDEAHVYCPEKGAGESEASDSVIGMATRGRKRGYCLVAATQRLGKFRKDAAAEMLNVMIGGTFIDIDRKRAADALGVYGKDTHAFFDEIKLLERGNFYALGPAISNERVLIAVGPIETTHPEAGSAKHAAEPPPAPEAIAKLLPKLSDLPKEAEEKAKTEAELRREIRELKAQVRSSGLQKVQPAAAKPAVDDRAIARAVERALVPYQKLLKDLHSRLNRITNEANSLGSLAGAAQIMAGAHLPKLEMPKVSGGEIYGKEMGVPAARAAEIQEPRQHNPRPIESNTPENNGKISGPQLVILRALNEWESLGRTDPTRAEVAALAEVSSRSSGYDKNLSTLKTLGLIDYRPGSRLTFTDEGKAEAPAPADLSDETAILDRCCSVISGPQAAILRELQALRGKPIGRPELAEKTGQSSTSSGFDKNLSTLRSAGMIEYGPGSTVKCANWLFLE
jgi:uncharacterized protein